MSKEKNSSYDGLPKSERFKDTGSVSSDKAARQIASSKTLMSRLFQRIQIIPVKMVMILSRLGQLVSSWSKSIKRFSAVFTLVVATILAGHTVSAQIINPGPSQPLASLKTVSIPEPDNLKDFVQDKAAAIALGKSLFWDMQVGGDGIQSCASCHFHAGTDNRSKNQINPGLNRVKADGNQRPDVYAPDNRNPDKTFDIGGHPNYQLTTANYPFGKQINDVTGSQGVFKADFVDIIPGSSVDKVTPVKDDVFNVKGINVRQVTDRNSPSTINAGFNFRNFWDGRAQNIFNGVNPFGRRDPNAFVLKANGRNRLKEVKIQLRNSSLASQAVGPPTSPVEEGGSPGFRPSQNSMALNGFQGST